MSRPGRHAMIASPAPADLTPVEAAAQRAASSAFARQWMTAGGRIGFARFMDDGALRAGARLLQRRRRASSARPATSSRRRRWRRYSAVAWRHSAPRCCSRSAAATCSNSERGRAQWPPRCWPSSRHCECLPRRYRILDVSADLRERQRETLARAVPHLLERVRWLDRLPDSLVGVVVANEVLDAMPVERFVVRGGRVMALGVEWRSGRFEWVESPASPCLRDRVERIRHGGRSRTGPMDTARN